MLLWALRGLFIVLIAAVAFSAVLGEANAGNEISPRGALSMMIAGIGFALLLIGIDMFLPRKSLAALSGAFLGLLVGMVAAWGFGLILQMLIEAYAPNLNAPGMAHNVVAAVKLMIGIVCCYLAISFVLQTKDDIRFVIPYVEFAKQTRGARPLILDTSVIIDGRVADICDT